MAPAAGQAQREGRAPGDWRGCWILPGEADGASDATLGPEASAFSLSLLSPFSDLGNETFRLGHGGSRDSAVSGVSGALSGKWWSGCPSHPGTDGAWHAVVINHPCLERARGGLDQEPGELLSRLSPLTGPGGLPHQESGVFPSAFLALCDRKIK